MSYEYSYIMDELVESDVIGSLVAGLFSGAPSFLLSVAAYVLSAMALYTVASRRGIRKPWMAWIPLVNVWILGSISDQYRYVVKGETKNKRKALLILNIINLVLVIAIIVFAVLLVIGAVRSGMHNLDENAVLKEILRPAIGLGCVGMILSGTAIAMAIIRYMALYDIYMSMDPGNCVLYLVLSIIFSISEPFFLFFNRTGDTGMPPRREAPTYVPPVEPWEHDSETEYM